MGLQRTSKPSGQNYIFGAFWRRSENWTTSIDVIWRFTAWLRLFSKAAVLAEVILVYKHPNIVYEHATQAIGRADCPATRDRKKSMTVNWKPLMTLSYCAALLIGGEWGAGQLRRSAWIR
jgi:hypothetical protein